MKIIFGVFLALFALIFLAVGVVALVGGRAQKKRCSSSATGTVVRLHMDQKPGVGARVPSTCTPPNSGSMPTA